MITYIIVSLLFCIAVLMFIREIQVAPVTKLSEHALMQYGLPASPEVEHAISERESKFAYIAQLKRRYALRRSVTHSDQPMSLPVVTA